MPLIDSHAHLTAPDLFGQVQDVLTRATAAGVEAIITIGTDLADGRRAIELAHRFPGRVHAALGFHPHEAGKVAPEDWRAMQSLLDDPAIVAFGEMGLDHHYDFSDRESQRRVFARQLEIASGRDLPLIIHSREAFEETSALLVDHGFTGRRVVFHCFTGTAHEAARAAELGWRVSFTGVVTFRKSLELQSIAREYPADRLMVETDAPYLSPEPVRGRRPCEPAFVAHTARFLAELRGEPYEGLVERTRENTVQFFGLNLQQRGAER